MAHMTTENNYINALCSRCGQEVKVYITTGISNGVNTCYNYHCQHCGHIGSGEIEPEHRTYNLDEILDSLDKIADSLDEIKDLLKECLK